MPSQNEILALQDAHPGLRVWSVLPANASDPSSLGEVAVVPFDDVVAAIATVETSTLEQAWEGVKDVLKSQQSKDLDADDLRDAIYALWGIE